MAWWREARFGMFIHWGPVSLKGTEIGWSRGGERRGYGGPGNEIPVDVYDNLYKQFNPVKFDADKWVAIAKAAGMKYMVFTSRHHDGFSEFDTKADGYKITSPLSPYRKDIVKQLADAARKAGMRFGVYYSQPNWHHPDAFTPDRHAKYLEYLKTQVRELCTNYGKLDVFWFDGLGKSAKDYDGEAIVKLIRGLQPGIIINNRMGIAEDFDTPEQEIGKYQDNRPWESCITICNQWAWKPNDTMKTLEQCLHTLIRCAGGDGNLLFNVGPMPTGEIEPRQVVRLKEMGAWLKKNGESIYGTRGGPWKPTRNLASTRKGDTAYVHLLRWVGPEFRLPAIGRKMVDIEVLGGGKVATRDENGDIVFTVKQESRRPIDTVVKLRYDRSIMDVPAVTIPSDIKATASNVFRNEEGYAAECAFDGDPNTRWATDGGTHQAWVALDLAGKQRTLSGVRIREAYGTRVQKFAFQVMQNGEWKTVLQGTTIGENFNGKFSKVTASGVRLQILEATEGPTIWEIEPY